MTKICTRCKEEKPDTDFLKESCGKNWVASKCKQCYKNISKEKYDNFIISEYPLEKKCSKCNIVKNISFFNKRKDSKDGLLGYCKTCESKHNAEKNGKTYIDKSLIKEGFKICLTCTVEKSYSNFTLKCARCKECVRKEDKLLVLEKKCTKCSVLKSVQEFHKNYMSKDGFTHICKTCKTDYNSNATLYEPLKNGSKSCSKCGLDKNYSDFNLDRKSKDGLTKNCSKCNADRTLTYKKLNKEKVRKYEKDRINNNPLIKMSSRVRGLISNTFKRACKGEFNKSQSSESIIGCTIEQFMNHLEELFTKNMSFENYGACTSGNCHKVWHIDHKIPISSAKTEEDIIRLNHYTNLQPMWAEENLRKWKNYD